MDCYVFVSRELIEDTLAVTYTQGKKELEPFKTFAKTQGLPYKIHQHPEVFQLAEVHLTEGDDWVCLEGEVEFIVGGVLKEQTWLVEKDGIVNPNEIRSKEIEGGTTIWLHSVEHLWIPAGTPHMHRSISRARSFIYKIPMGRR